MKWIVEAMKQKHAQSVHREMVHHGVMDSACGQMANVLIMIEVGKVYFTQGKSKIRYIYRDLVSTGTTGAFA